MAGEKWLTHAEIKRAEGLIEALHETTNKARNYLSRYKQKAPNLEGDRLARIIATTLIVTARAFERYAISIDRKALGLPEASKDPDVKG